MKYILITLLAVIGTLRAVDYQPSLSKFLETHAGYSAREVTDDEKLATEIYTRKSDNVTYFVYAKNGEIIAYTVTIETHGANPQDTERALLTALTDIFPQDRFFVAQTASSSSGQNARFDFVVRDKVLYERAQSEAKSIAEQKLTKLTQDLKKQLQP